MDQWEAKCTAVKPLAHKHANMHTLNSIVQPT